MIQESHDTGVDVKNFLESLPPSIRRDLEAKTDAYRETLPGYAKRKLTADTLGYPKAA